MVAWVRFAVAAGYPCVRAPNPLVGTARVPEAGGAGMTRVRARSDSGRRTAHGRMADGVARWAEDVVGEEPR
ncbi:hypothetical protein GCM10009566_72270 [Streptomyces murinus]